MTDEMRGHTGGRESLPRPSMPHYTYKTILISFAILLAVAIAVFVEVNRPTATQSDYTGLMLDDSQVPLDHVKVAAPADTLVVYDSSSEDSVNARTAWEQTFGEMRVGYREADIQGGSFAPDGYQTVLLVVPDYNRAASCLETLKPWVERGGRLIVGTGFVNVTSLDGYDDLLGTVPQDSYGLFDPKDFLCEAGFMVGGDTVYQLDMAMTESLRVRLSTGKAEASTTEGDPLVWTNSYGSGQVCAVNVNFNSRMGYGVYAQAYSLLGDSCVYPVIDSSTYFLDDCPSPEPLGNSAYIERDYQMSIGQFYSSVWWPAMNRLAREHDIRYTGALIETYDDRTNGKFARPTSATTSQHYGSLLFGQSGELALHGYNHQPLVDDWDYYQSYDTYKVWKDEKAMADSVYELQSYAAAYFPQAKTDVYVPPSNVLSPAGRDLLAQNPSIRAICSIYLPGTDAYAQEFTVAPDGVVEAPRILSGEFTSDDDLFLAFSELNLHYVNSRFTHPDDVLDPDRGAEQGWAAMERALGDYMTWVDESAPGIRRLTASGLAGAVQRFATVTPQVIDTGTTIEIDLDGFVDDARLMVRLNEGTVGHVSGGSVTKLGDSLYLVDADEPHVTIYREAS